MRLSCTDGISIQCNLILLLRILPLLQCAAHDIHIVPVPVIQRDHVWFPYDCFGFYMAYTLQLISFSFGMFINLLPTTIYITSRNLQP